MVSRGPDQVNNVLIAAGTVCGAHILLAKHGVVLFQLLLLQCHDHFVQLLNLSRHDTMVSQDGNFTYALLKCSNLLLQSLLVRDQILQLVDQILQPLHHPLLQVRQVLLRRCVCQLRTELFMLTRILRLVLLKLFPQLGEALFQILRGVAGHRITAVQSRSFVHLA